MSSGSAVFNSRYSRAVLSKSDWEDHREFIHKHYLEDDKTLEDLKILLKENLGVEVTKHQLEYRCRRWKFRKNYSQTYPRQSENQSVLKFPPLEAKKSRLKQKAPYEPRTGSASEKVRTPQDETTEIPSLTTPGSFRFLNGFFPPDATGLSFCPAMMGDYDGSTAAPKQAEICSTTQKTSHSSFVSTQDQNELFDGRGPYDVELYRSTNPHSHEISFDSYDPGLDSVEHQGDSLLSLNQSASFETSLRESLQERDYKHSLWPQRLPQDPLILNANGLYRDDISAALDSPSVYGGSFPYQCHNDLGRSEAAKWTQSQLDSNIYAAPSIHLSHGSLENTLPGSMSYMVPVDIARRSGLGCLGDMGNRWTDNGST